MPFPLVACDLEIGKRDSEIRVHQQLAQVVRDVHREDVEHVAFGDVRIVCWTEVNVEVAGVQHL